MRDIRLPRLLASTSRPRCSQLGPGFSVKMAVVPCADFEQAVDCQYMFGATKRHS